LSKNSLELGSSIVKCCRHSNFYTFQTLTIFLLSMDTNYPLQANLQSVTNPKCPFNYPANDLERDNEGNQINIYDVNIQEQI